MEAHSQLPTHPTRARGRRDIRRNGHSLELLMPLRNRLPKRYTLRTRPYRVRRILNIRTIDILAVFRDYRGPNAELGVRAVCGSFGGRAAGVQSVELGGAQGIGFAGLGDVGFVV
jgi:hypothetical protein